jgi:2-oxoglutarate dehydrogenase E1 component
MGVDTTVEVTMPAMGDSVTEGIVLEWHKNEGEQIGENETLVEISTDKVDTEIPSPTSGVVTKILAGEGDTIEVGGVLAEIRPDDGAAQSNGSNGGDKVAAAAPSETVTKAPPAATTNGTSPPTVETDANASPVAQRAAQVLNVDLEKIKGTGPAGRIFKADVIAATKNGTSAAAPATGELPEEAKRTALRGASGILAKYMDESLSVPTATSFRTLTVSTLDTRRKALKAAGQKVSFTHLIAYAIAKAAAEMSVMADHYELADGVGYRIEDGQINLGIAVDVERKDGSRTLMVPVIRDAGRLSFSAFMAAFGDLITRARENALTADDLVGANISLTNPGGIGTIASVPRLMKGQGTIIAAGAIGYPPGLEKIGASIGAEKVVTLTSTYDHRIIQGAESGRFLQIVDKLLQGEDGFYEQVFADLSVELAPTSEAPAAASPSTAAAPAAQPTTAAAPVEPAVLNEPLLRAVQAATSLVKAHRMHGHLAARLDPLGSDPEHDPALDPDNVDLTPELMAQIPSSVLRTYVEGETLAEALPNLHETYCGTIAYEIEHISSHRQRTWLRRQIESGAYRQPLPAEEKKGLLKRLIQVDTLERFIHRAYIGQKQFSLEGLDMTVPMLDELIELAANDGAKDVVLGMAHRGRLNVLAHNLGREYEVIFREFEGASSIEAVTTIPQGGTGDVKYHHGAQGTHTTVDGRTVTVHLQPNPSHLEYVSPVVEGATRAYQTVRGSTQTSQNHKSALAVILHGDAAFPAQGVVAETLNLQALDGYTIGGAVHLIQNNQIGFTTDPEDARSTRWASDLAKGFDIPIIHVNADDVAACISAVRLAFAFRQEFGHDVLIDLIGYRRYGHNEADEPAYTQPEMVALIKQKAPVNKVFSEQLIADGTLLESEVEALETEISEDLATRHRELKSTLENGDEEEQRKEYKLDRRPSPKIKTAVSKKHLVELNDFLYSAPEGFSVHPKLLRQMAQRLETVGPDGGIDWAQAETLAFASLLAEGIPVRLTGQDSERGTFSQRHLVLHDHKTGQRYSPLQHLPEARATMELHNSPLSEIACLGFEYGYSQQAVDTLVLWEAQFGDFVNSAQVVIDQFIVSGLAKWGQTARLTLLLPHGYEGSGPEHSSARMERFLQLAAEGNIRIACPTTPAQYFHLLRRQAYIAKRRPLILATAKSLLRLQQATSKIEDFSDSEFFSVLPEKNVDPEKVTRLVLCTGKIYYDLIGHTSRENNEQLAVTRVELLYPFPQKQIEDEIARYPNLKQVVWVQEEPRNMGAREYMAPRLMHMLPDHLEFGYLGRKERASTSEGYPAAHTTEQNRLIRSALNLETVISPHPLKPPGER